MKAEGTSRVTWEIEPVGDSCKLVVTHDQLREGANDEIYGGWPQILSGLKTLLETGEHADDTRLAALRAARRLIGRSLAASSGGVPSRPARERAHRRGSRPRQKDTAATAQGAAARRPREGTVPAE